MRHSTVVGDGRRPPWWRTALWIALVGFTNLFAVVFSPVGWAAQPGNQGEAARSSALLFAGVVMLAAVGLPVALAWRHRYPFGLVALAALAPLVMPLGAGLALTSLSSMIGRRRGPAVWWASGLVAASTIIITTMDALAQPKGASLLKAWFAPQSLPASAEAVVTPWEAVTVVVLSLGLAVGLGLMVRARREAASARVDAQTERAASTRLGDEAARRQERERIAREVHDAMGHRLSLLSLHAGALQANASDPRIVESAQVVRESAAAAMGELRSLLALLHTPDGEAELPAVGMEHLAAMVQESFGVGQQLSSSILIEDPQSAPPALTRAVYRIVQELLTNARRHAPGQPVMLSVQGNPRGGVQIECRNPILAAPPTTTLGQSRGLAGIGERAHLLGGTVAYGVDAAGFFRVRVELPWRTPTAP